MLTPIKNRLIIVIIILSLFFPVARALHKAINIDDYTALAIGMQIWNNENGGKISGLIAWNKGEKCASLGIGHFTWYPFPHGTWQDGFPQFLKYLATNNIALPTWLNGDLAKYAIWQDRQEFLEVQSSPRMKELQQFMQNTIAMQARFMAHQLEIVLPKLLAKIPPYERPYVCEQFYKLARMPAGLYAMIDYLNFRGTGAITNENHNMGLLQVLRDMRYAPKNATPLEAFIWSAKNAITRHLANAPDDTYETHWIVGWLKRVDRYAR